MTDHELIQYVLSVEFPEIEKARSITNPFDIQSWIQALSAIDKEREYNRLKDMLDEIELREDQLLSFPDEKLEQLREKFFPTVNPHIKSSAQLRKRGRPLNKLDPHTNKQDQIIGRTAQQLVLWGFSRRGEVYPSIARHAPKILSHNHYRDLNLSPSRIEQIHEKWQQEYEIIYRKRVGIDPLFKRSRYTKSSLERFRPSKRLPSLVCVLLKNRGYWLNEASIEQLPGRALELTPKTEKELTGMPRIQHKKKRGN